MSTQKKQSKPAANNILTDEQLALRNQVLEMELKARYWKAQFETKYYTLESSKLDETYTKFLQDQREREIKAYEEYQAKMREVQEKQEAGAPVPSMSVVPETVEG